MNIYCPVCKKITGHRSEKRGHYEVVICKKCGRQTQH